MRHFFSRSAVLLRSGLEGEAELRGSPLTPRRRSPLWPFTAGRAQKKIPSRPIQKPSIYHSSMKSFLSTLLLASLLLISKAHAEEVLLFQDGKAGPLHEKLKFFHGSWKFAEGAMLGEQVPTEKHTATIKALIPFDRLKVEWKMKFAQPKETFLFVAWPADSGAHAIDFTFNPDAGQFAIVRPRFKNLRRAILAEGKLAKLDTEWHELVCIHDGARVTVTIDGVSITAEDESFNRPMGPFFLNGGGFDGAQFLVKDLRVTSLQ